MERGKKKEAATYNKSALGTYKKPNIKKAKAKPKSSAQKQASERFRKITEKAQSIRNKHPKMKWRNAIKKASKELF